MRKAIRGFVLTMLLTCSAYAGEIPNDKTSTPPPATSANIFGETALGLLQTLLAIV